MVISKPKRISVADGVVHMVVLLVDYSLHTGLALVCITTITGLYPEIYSENH